MFDARKVFAIENQHENTWTIEKLLNSKILPKPITITVPI